MKRLSGFTLIELMIVVVIIGILASIAYPSYINFITKSNRAEAHAALMKVANLQEQYYLDNKTYATDLTDLGLNASPFLTDNGIYEVSSAGTSQFTVSAKALGAQATRDTSCGTITITDTGVKAPGGCW